MISLALWKNTTISNNRFSRLFIFEIVPFPACFAALGVGREAFFCFVLILGLDALLFLRAGDVF